ncbi:MAG: lipoyl(octanoyl) transferase LipB [Candidatus Eisenbacteria bacterium]|nr:lipoyl(octanoyl) transferase LipB [Candidatus Eisenbacteria bacterium]
MPTLTACALGRLPYRDGLRLQEALVRARSDGETGDWLLYPDHPPVLTVGRNPSEDNLRVPVETLDRLGIERFEVARGGDITWHGPGQLVGYAILDLTARDRDLHRFLRDLERSLIATLEGLSLPAGIVPGRTGVWLSGEKIASIGVAVRRWVSYHGFALNVHPDLKFFKLIHPCGLRGIEMTSIAARLGSRAPGLEQVRVRTTNHLAETFGYRALRWAEPDEAWRTAGETAPEHLSSARHAAA